VLFGGTAAAMMLLVVLGWVLARAWAPELDAPGPVDPQEAEVVITSAD